MQQFKIRASAATKIMGIKGLGQTGKSYCEEWIKEQIYNRKKEFTSKYTEKGLTMEDDAIKYASNYLGWGDVKKNEQHFSDEYIQGTPDIILPDSIEDIKCSWDCFTFPLFDTEPDRSYVIQLNCYMNLTGKKKAGLNYCLMDTPEHIIEAEARKISYKSGVLELDAELFDQVQESMTYKNINDENRVKRFDINIDLMMIKTIKERVYECRQYIASIWPDYSATNLHKQ